MLDDSGDPAFKDECGIQEAYNAAYGVALHGDTLYISGTRSIGDVLDDAYIPFKAVHKTQRYQQALAALKKGKGRVTQVVGHSLGGAVAARLIEDRPDLVARVYGAPLYRGNASSRVTSYRHFRDPISFLDKGELVSTASGWNAHSYKGC